jgi:hypothetical protein
MISQGKLPVKMKEDKDNANGWNRYEHCDKNGPKGPVCYALPHPKLGRIVYFNKNNCGNRSLKSNEMALCDVEDAAQMTCTNAYPQNKLNPTKFGPKLKWSQSYSKRPAWEYGPHGGQIWSHLGHIGKHNCKEICRQTSGCKYYKERSPWKGAAWCYFYPEGYCKPSTKKGKDDELKLFTM